MSETCLFDDEKMAHAVDAAKKAARRAGVAANEATVLYRSRRVVLLFPEIATVARVGSADEACLAADARELSVARRLVLRPHNLAYAVDLLEIPPGETPADAIAGRVVLILNEF